MHEEAFSFTGKASLFLSIYLSFFLFLFCFPFKNVQEIVLNWITNMIPPVLAILIN